MFKTAFVAFQSIDTCWFFFSLRWFLVVNRRHVNTTFLYIRLTTHNGSWWCHYHFEFLCLCPSRLQQILLGMHLSCATWALGLTGKSALDAFSRFGKSWLLFIDLSAPQFQVVRSGSRAVGGWWYLSPCSLDMLKMCRHVCVWVCSSRTQPLRCDHVQCENFPKLHDMMGFRLPWTLMWDV